MVCFKLRILEPCFCPQTFFRDTRFEGLSWNSLVSGLHHELALSAGLFQALWLIVLVVLLYARFTPNSRGTWDWLTTKNDQTRGYSGVGPQGRMFLLCYSPEGHKLLPNSRHNVALLAIGPRPLLIVKNGRGTCQFHLRVTQLVAGSSFGRKSSQVGRKSLDVIVCHSARS